MDAATMLMKLDPDKALQGIKDKKQFSSGLKLRCNYVQEQRYEGLWGIEGVFNIHYTAQPGSRLSK